MHNKLKEELAKFLNFITEDFVDQDQIDSMEDTPERWIKMMKEVTEGYDQEPAEILSKTFKQTFEQMIVVKHISFNSTCLVGSTFIETPRGRIPINRLKDGEFVYCFDETNLRMTVAQAKNPRVTGKMQRLWRVFTDKDTLLCTGDHKVLTGVRGWVKACELVTGDSVVAFNRGAHPTGNGGQRSNVTWTGLTHQVPEHILIYESLNAPVPKGYVVHHINKNPNDNRPENLTRLSIGDHARLHRLEDGPTGFALYTDEMRLEMKGRQVKAIRESQTEEVRRKRSKSLKRYWDSLTLEQRADRNHKVLSVEQTEWREDVWCMDVPGYENFIANGIVVHNCEHHLLPFTGHAHVAYIPSGPVVGLSKIPRLVDCFARRLQIQERMTEQIADAMVEHLNPIGVGVIIQAEHQCMTCRGVRKQGAVMITSALRGDFMTDPQVRQEFLSLR